MKKIGMMTALLCSVAAIGYDNETGWKMDGDKLALDGDGNPIWINPAGQEASVKGDTISRLNGESAAHRKRAETAEAKLATFDGITDPEAARKAIETVRDIDTSKLINAGKLDEVKAEITKQFETRITASDEKAAAAAARADKMLLDNAFAMSEFARDGLTDAGRDLARSMFSDRFKVVDDKVVAYDNSGNQIYSDKSVGDPASFDEALQKMIGGYKHKDSILKAADAGGSGSNGDGGARGRGRTLNRSQFEALDPVQQQDFAAKMSTGETALVD